MEEKLKILIVDDDEVDRMAVYRALKKAGVSMIVVEAEDCDTALFHLKSSSFDCVFLDYRLPDKDGLELLKELELTEIRVPLIVLTGQGDERIAVELMKAGAADYLSKSRISPETLSQVLRNAIRIHQAEMEVELANKRLRESNELLIHKNQELEKQRQQIELQNQQLLEVSRLKSQFLANMSHELRTPMNAIMGFSQLLLRQYPDPLTPRQMDMVQRIFNNGQHLLTMLNEVLDFSKIESGRLELNLEKFDLAHLITITTEELRCLADEKKLELNVHIELENSDIFNDKNCCRRILVNLISNAIKFTEFGYIKIKVWDLPNERIAINVEDSGVGIAQEHLKVIFKAFQQVDQSITRKHAGTGLGLAITNTLVEVMGGKIAVDSTVRKGSTFRVELPRQVRQKKHNKHLGVEDTKSSQQGFIWHKQQAS